VFESELRRPECCVIVILGASGDLTQRKLAPALYNLAKEELLPECTTVLGYGRTAMTDGAFREHLQSSISRFSRTQPVDKGVWDSLAANVFYQQGAYDERESFVKLHSRLQQLDQRAHTRGNCIFYLAVPPEVVTPILDNLSATGSLSRLGPTSDKGRPYLRVVFEKPFGHDLKSARELNNGIDRLLDETQIFRMDHYLGKETVQNISVLRFANSVFERVWRTESVHYIRVTVAETLGVEDRGGYFDSTGILRDILQNHVLQLLTLVTMEPPSSLAADAIRDEKVKVLRCLRRMSGHEIRRSVVRGQYGHGVVNKAEVPPYRREKGVDPHSNTETFVGIRTYIDNWRWAGVPIYLCAGKRLPVSLTEVSIEFKAVPAILFGAMKGVELTPNRLKLRIQPDEGVSLRFASKVPGLGMELKTVEMDFPYASAFRAASPEAYERLLLDVMAGNSALFTRRDEVELAWEFATGILEAWEKEEPPRFPNYAAGTWGPIASDKFFSPDTVYAEAMNA